MLLPLYGEIKIFMKENIRADNEQEWEQRYRNYRDMVMN